MNQAIMLAAVLGMVGWTTGWADDHGDTWDSATSFPLETMVSGTLETADDVDFFRTIFPPSSPYYGFAVFPGYAQIQAGLLSGYDPNGQPESDNLFCFLGRGDFSDQNETNYFRISYRFGSGGDGYHMASVVFPDTATPIGDLVEYNLSPAAPVDARLYNLDAGLYAVGVCPTGSDWRAPGFASWEILRGGGGGGIGPWNNSGSDIVALIRIGVPSTQRSLSHYPRWEDMGSAGKNCGIRLQPCVPEPLVGGQGTGRIATAFEIDAWSMTLQPNTSYVVWLTDSNGAVVNSGYHLGVFESNDVNPHPLRRAAQAGRGLPFRTSGNTNYVFTVFANVAKDGNYDIHVKTHVDDYGRWSGDTPPIGTATPNVAATGNLEVPPDEDGFQVAMAAGNTYAIYSPDEDRFDLSMNGDWSWFGNYSGDLFTAPAAGTGSVTVAYGWGEAATTGSYQFTVSEFLDDADNDQEHAIPLVVGGPPVTNDLKAPGDMDWFVFNVVSGKTYRLTGGDGLQLRIYYRSTWNYSRSSTSAFLDFPVTYTGLCYAVVRASPTAGAYSTSVAEASADPYGDWSAGIDWQGKPSGATDDADEDGFTNDQERIAGTDPTLEGDLFKATAATTTSAGDGIVLGTALAGRVYTARYTTDLMLDWSLWLPATLSIVGDQIVAPLDPARSNAVYRLMVELE